MRKDNWRFEALARAKIVRQEEEVRVLRNTPEIEDFKPSEEIERLQTINADLLEEHKHWAKITGRILVEALQGEFEYLKVVAMNTKINFRNGEPMLESEILNRIEGGE